jgi:hypothetical protein
VLDPVTTLHLFILQVLHRNTACSHLPHLSGAEFPRRRTVRPVPGCRWM